MPCQTSFNATFITYPTGSILGTAPVAFTPPPSPTSTWTQPNTLLPPTLPTHQSADVAAAPTQTLRESTSPSIITLTASTAPTSMPTAASAQSQTPRSSELPSTAIGAVVGVPLAVAAIGFLVFLFSRGANGRNGTESVNVRCESEREKSAVVAERPPRADLRDPRCPLELDGATRRAEMSGTVFPDPSFFLSFFFQSCLTKHISVFIGPGS